MSTYTRKGGGMVIPCQYVVRFEKMAISAAKTILQNAINEMQEKDVMQIKTMLTYNVRISKTYTEIIFNIYTCKC